MEVTFAPKGIVQIDDARIIFRNFSGKASKYNAEGNRNFAVVIPNQEIADELIKDGWNVHVKPPREEDDEPFRYLPVKIKINEKGPFFHLVSGNSDILLDEDNIGRLDQVDISKVDLDIRPYDWTINGKDGRTAYLQSIKVVQNIRDRFAADYGYPVDSDEDEELPFD